MSSTVESRVDYVVYNLKVSASNAASKIGQFQSQPWILTRAYGQTAGIAGGLDTESQWDAALAAGCGVLATNEVSDHSWAMVGDEPIVPKA